MRPRAWRAGHLILWFQLAGSLFAPSAARAEARPTIVVTPGTARTYKIAVQEFSDSSTPDERINSQTYRDALVTALDFSGDFESIGFEAFLGPADTQLSEDGELSDDQVLADCSDWSQIGADGLVEGSLGLGESGFTAEFRVWDATRCTRLLAKRYRQAGDADPSAVARRMADDIVSAFTGLRGVASTEIAFVSNRSGNSEIYVMDAGGSSVRSATDNRSVNMFPSWSPSGDAIVYTSYRHLNRPFLFMTARAGRSPGGRVLTELSSEMQQFRGVFDPSGEHLAVVIANDEAAEIYTVGSDGKGLRKLTNNRSIDVSPTWSPDGSQIAFVSDRAGTPQIYVMGADGANVRRLTYDGRYNTAPAWSPDGLWIAYEVRVGAQFDIWLIDPNVENPAAGIGVATVPLVTHPASDESPSWAPNSRMLAFSSMRRGRSDIYVIDLNGDNLRRLTRNAGDNKSPSWGRFSR